MEFLKNNWSKLVIAAIALVGAILMIMPLTTAPEINFIGACQILGPLVFFIGLFAVMILKMFDKTKPYKKYVLLGAGLISLVLMCIGLVGFQAGTMADVIAGNGKGEGVLGTVHEQFRASAKALKGVALMKKQYDAALTAANTVLFTYISMIFVFGLIPTVRGINKVCKHFFCKDTKKAAAKK